MIYFISEYHDYFLVLKRKWMNDLNELNKGFLEEYINPKKTKAKIAFYIIILITFFTILYVFIIDTNKRMSTEELRASIKLFNIESKWISNGTINDGESKKIILVPTISFRIKNIGIIDLSYLSVVGVFRFHSNEKFLGEGNKMVLKEPLKPGSSSNKQITIISDRGYRASSINAFIDNEKEWQTTFVDVFMKIGGYKHVKIKRFNISRRIKGMQLNVNISEPENGDKE